MTRVFRIAFYYLLLIGGLVICKHSTYAQDPIKSDFLSEDAIQDLMKANENLPRQISSPTEGDRWIKVLMGTGLFERVTLFRNNGTYSIQVDPLLKTKEIRILGNSQVRLSEIRNLLPFEEGDKFDRLRIVKFGEAIKRLYGERGFLNAEVDLQFERTSSDQMKITVIIAEKEICAIEDVRIESDNKTLNERLQQKLTKFKMKPLSSDQYEKISDYLKTYLRQNQFLRTQVLNPKLNYNTEKTRATIVFPLTNPVRYQLFFSGNKYFSKSDLYKMIRAVTQSGSQLRPKSDVPERIKEQYRTEGFPQTKIEINESFYEQIFVRRLKLNIVEGPRVKIEDWQIKGRISRDPQFYITKIRSSSSGAIKKGFYNKEDLEQSLQNLVGTLRNEGYLRAKYQSSTIDFKSEDRVRLNINFDEGPRTLITRIEFIGSQQIESEDLLVEFGLDPNSPLRIKELEKAVERIKRYYQRSGFLEMKILNQGPNLIEFNERGTQAQIRLKIFEGPQVKVKKVLIEGNSFTKEEVIQKELSFRPGEILTPEDLENSLIRLNRLGVFARVNIQMLEEKTNISDRTLIVKVTERDPGIYRLGMGLNSERKLTARGFTSISYNNLFGTARSVTGRVELQSNIADINYLEHRASLSYLEPFLFNTRTRGRVSLTRTDEVFNNFIIPENSREITQIITSDRLDFRLERELNRNYQLFLTLWSIDNRRERERNGFCSRIEDGDRCPGTTQTISLFGPTIDIDYRDNSFLPTRGVYSRLSFNYSHPSLGSSELIEFFRTEGVFNYYIPVVGPKLVWANSLGAGYVANLSDRPNSGVPTRYAFFLGGAQTVRGFEFTSTQDRIPNDRELPLTTGNELIIPQDSHYALIKSEMRWSVIGEHGAVLFYDGGLVKVTGKTFRLPYRHAAGVGYRYNTPVGPVRLDVGFKLDRQRIEGEGLEQLYRFHFAIGTF